MKSTYLVVFILTFAAVVFQGCSGTSSDSSPEKKETKEMKKEPVAPVKEPEKPKEEKLEPATVKVQINFESDDFTEEDGTVTKGSVYDVVDSKTKMSYTFCYDSESYKNFKLIGNGKELTLTIKNGNKTIFQKEGFELNDKMTFSSKDFNFEMAAKYTIELRQRETTLFTGKIGSEGCM